MTAIRLALAQINPAVGALEENRKKITEIDCGGRVVLPGFVDSHTHPVFAQPRLVDFEKRIATIYQQCRTPEQIQFEFDQLQRELETEITVAVLCGGVAEEVPGLNAGSNGVLKDRRFHKARQVWILAEVGPQADN